MKARLKSTQEKEVTRLSDMEEGQFALATSGKWFGGIVYRPFAPDIFAIDLTSGCYWKDKVDKGSVRDMEIRILKAGELIEIVK